MNVCMNRKDRDTLFSLLLREWNYTRSHVFDCCIAHSRAEMNEFINRLKNLLPEHMVHSKLTKLEILQKTVEHLTYMHKISRQLMNENTQLRLVSPSLVSLSLFCCGDFPSILSFFMLYFWYVCLCVSV